MSDSSNSNDQGSDDSGLLDKIKSAIPGDVDDKVLDSAGDAVGKMGDAASSVGDAMKSGADKVTDAIPGDLDDKVADGIASAAGKVSDLASQVTGGDDSDQAEPDQADSSDDQKVSE